MKKKIDLKPEIIIPDLKHDTMEFTASTEGDEILDMPDEDAEITPEELNALYEDDEKEEAEALKTASMDSEIDEDNFIIEADNLEELDTLKDDENKN